MTPPPRRILVVGTPRSGTTWIAQALAQTPGAAYVHEPDNHRHTPCALRAKRGLGPFPQLKADARSRRFERLWSTAFAGAVSPDARGRAWERHPARRPSVAATDAYVTARFGSLERRVAVAALRAKSPESPAVDPATVVVKSVQAMLSLEWLAERFEPEIVLVQRHPLNVLASWLAMGFDELGKLPREALKQAEAEWGVAPPAVDASLVARLAWRIGFLTATVRGAASRVPATLVRHERLCADPANGYRRLADDLGLAWPDEAAAWVAASDTPGGGYATRRVAAEQPDNWRRLDRDVIDEALKALRGLPLGDLGEPPDAASRSDATAPPRCAEQAG